MLVIAALTTIWFFPSVLGGSRYRLLNSEGRYTGTVAVFVSGDNGIHFGMGPSVTRALAARGIPVIAISSPTAFGTTQTRAGVDATVEGGIRQALAIPRAQRVLLIGQSFGADMVSTVLPDLPAALRAKVAAVTLVVPGETAYFRADPLNLSYHGPPDARPAARMRSVDWVPVFCIYGAAETDSLCPQLKGTKVHIQVLPGGHFLAHDDARLIATILRQLDTVKV